LRLGIEADHEAQVFGQGTNYFHVENVPWSHAAIQACLRLTGLYGRARRNVSRIQINTNEVRSARIPAGFDGFSILHLSDLHVDSSGNAMAALHTLLPTLEYDICVLTGDYRGRTSGPYEAAVDGMAAMCKLIDKPLYGVLGNHDTVAMLPALEEIGIRMLLNESIELTRGSERIHLAGIDDAHFYRADDIERAATGIPASEFSILLSHTPEVYQQAARAKFDLMLSGHTHGGQICLPGRIAITLGSVLPRRFGAGAWKHNDMSGYTSVGAGCSIVAARLNCPPEITIHHLRSSP
jgi:uncharacterized protein